MNEAFAEPDRYLGIAMIRGGLEVLVRKGFVTDKEIGTVAASDDPVLALLEANVIGEREFALARAWDGELLFLNGDWGTLDVEARQEIDLDLARRLGILAIRREGDTLKVAVRDPLDLFGLMRAERASGCRIKPILVMRGSSIARALALP